MTSKNVSGKLRRTCQSHTLIQYRKSFTTSWLVSKWTPAACWFPSAARAGCVQETCAMIFRLFKNRKKTRVIIVNTCISKIKPVPVRLYVLKCSVLYTSTCLKKQLFFNINSAEYFVFFTRKQNQFWKYFPRVAFGSIIPFEPKQN